MCAPNCGFPREMQRYVGRVLNGEQPLETGHDRCAVLEIVLAAYESAGTGWKVMLPFVPPEVERPIEVWQGTYGVVESGRRDHDLAV